VKLEGMSRTKIVNSSCLSYGKKKGKVQVHVTWFEPAIPVCKPWETSGRKIQVVFWAALNSRFHRNGARNYSNFAPNSECDSASRIPKH
jgi:hypothetical protein